MSVLDISIVEKATASSVEKTLLTVAEKAGTPVQIVSDKGSSIKKGVADFIGKNSGARHTYDATHKAAILMKHHLKNDSRWKALTKEIWTVSIASFPSIGSARAQCHSSVFLFIYLVSYVRGANIYHVKEPSATRIYRR